MAKKSSIEKNARRRRMSKQYSGRRARVKAIAMDKTKPMEERFSATLKLAELPRNSSATRIRNRCEITGRPRGFAFVEYAQWSVPAGPRSTSGSTSRTSRVGRKLVPGLEAGAHRKSMDGS